MCTKPKLGIFFDLDGTLTDNIKFMLASYRAFMSKLSLPHSEQQFNFFNGTPIAIFLSYIKDKYELKNTIDELSSTYQAIIEKNHSSIAPREGVVELFFYLAKKNIPYAIVTSSKKIIANNWIKNNIPAKLIPPLISFDDYEEGKPSPLPYLFAMGELDCDSGFAVEDSENGVISAASAGLKVFQIGSKDDTKFHNAWRKVNSFKEVKYIINEL